MYQEAPLCNVLLTGWCSQQRPPEAPRAAGPGQLGALRALPASGRLLPLGVARGEHTGLVSAPRWCAGPCGCSWGCLQLGGKEGELGPCVPASSFSVSSGGCFLRRRFWAVSLPSCLIKSPKSAQSQPQPLAREVCSWGAGECGSELLPFRTQPAGHAMASTVGASLLPLRQHSPLPASGGQASCSGRVPCTGKSWWEADPSRNLIPAQQEPS